MTGNFTISKREMMRRGWTENIYCAIHTEKLGRVCNGICYMKKTEGDKVTYYWATKAEIPPPDQLEKMKAFGYKLLEI